MARVGQEGLNNFLTDHHSSFLLGCEIMSLGRRQKRLGRHHPSVDTDMMKVRSKCTSLHAVDGWPIERDESDRVA